MSIYKQIFEDVNVLLGKLFFKSHSGFLRCFNDQFRILISPSVRLNEWVPIYGDVDVATLELKDYEGAGFTQSCSLSHMPNQLRQIIINHIDDITAYLGEDFLFEPAISWINKELPEWALNYDIYSNVWHMDSHDGLRLLKIFVHLKDTGHDDGPMIFLDRNKSKKYFSLFWHRWTFDNVRKGSPIVVEGETRFTSKRGGYLIIDTGNCFHRASSPRGGGMREMLQITLYPSWLKRQGEVRKNISEILK